MGEGTEEIYFLFAQIMSSITLMTHPWDRHLQFTWRVTQSHHLMMMIVSVASFDDDDCVCVTFRFLRYLLRLDLWDATWKGRYDVVWKCT